MCHPPLQVKTMAMCLLPVLFMLLWASPGLHAQPAANERIPAGNKPAVAKDRQLPHTAAAASHAAGLPSQPTSDDLTASSMVTLAFKSDGQLTSNPPEQLKPGDLLAARVQLDRAFWAEQINKEVASWLQVLETLNKYTEQNKLINYGISPKDVKEVQEEIKYQLTTYLSKTALLPKEQKEYYARKIELLLPGATNRTTQLYVPTIDQLINPSYTVAFHFYNKEGLRIDQHGALWTQAAEDTYALNALPGGKGSSQLVFQGVAVIVPVNCFEVTYHLRRENALSKVTLAWAKDKAFPKTLLPVLSKIEKVLDEKFLQEHKKLLDAAGKLRKDTLDPVGADIENLMRLAKKQKMLTDSLIQNLNQKGAASWVKQWLWLTGGIPQLNPFGYERQSLISGKGEEKVSEVDKAQYQLFDNLVSKGALQLSSLDQVEENLSKLAGIKARMEAEAKAAAKEEPLYDTFLYQGLLKASSGQHYMRHLDARNNFLIMHVKPKEEIHEGERLYILAENKLASTTLNISFATSAITADESFFTTQVPMDSGGRKSFPFTMPELKKVSNAKIKEFLAKVDSLGQNVAALRTVTNAPSLPVFFAYDKTPAYMTQVLEHNFLYEAPATATYVVTTPNPDNTEKEVHKGSYRINKLYRWRFKAGLLYSHFSKDDYTKTGDNQFTLEDPRHGIDGTFGIQTYFRKQDIRSSTVDWTRYYLYTGLSMRNITENFYVGLGTEPISGLALGLNLHVGTREVLTGAAGVPTAIKQAWGVGVGGSVLIDAALFVRLFSFGSARSHLGM